MLAEGLGTVPVFIASGLVLILAAVSAADGPRPIWLSVLGGSMLMALLALQFDMPGTAPFALYRPEILAFTFAFLLSLVMIIAEAWRVTARIRHGACYVPLKQGQTEDVAVENHVSGTNFALCLFPPLILLTVLHPATNRFYAVAITIVMFAQFICWFSGNRSWSYGVWNVLGLSVGFLLPWLVALGTQVGETPVGPALLESTATTLTVTAIGIALLLFHAGAFLYYVKDEPIWGENILPRPFVSLVGAVSAVMCVAVGFLGMREWSASSTMGQRLSFLKFTYLLICVLTAIAYFIILGFEYVSKRKSQ